MKCGDKVSGAVVSTIWSVLGKIPDFPTANQSIMMQTWLFATRYVANDWYN